MKNIFFRVGVLLILNTAIFAKYAFCQSANNSYTSTLGESYISIYGINTIAFNKPIFADPDFILSSGKTSVSLDYTIGFGIKSFKDYYLSLKMGRSSFKGSYAYTFPPNYNVESHYRLPYYNVRLGVERFFNLKMPNLFFSLNPNILLIKTQKSEQQLLGAPYFYNVSSSRNWLAGLNLEVQLEYIFWKRFALIALVSNNYILNSSNINTYTVFSEDLTFNTKTNYFVQSLKLYFFNYGVGIKVGLEHKSFYNKTKK